jgi:hypothetical protein
MNTCSNIKSFEGLSSHGLFFSGRKSPYGRLGTRQQQLETDVEGKTGISEDDFAAESAALRYIPPVLLA